MHGRSRMTIDPRVPTKCRDGARRVFADQADTGLAPSAERNARCPASRRLNGERCIPLRTASFEADALVCA